MRNNFLQSVLKVDNVGAHMEDIVHTAASKPHLLIELFKEIIDRYSQPFAWQIDSVRERIITSLCLTKGEKQIQCLLEIVPLMTEETELRSIANMLAFAQDYQVLTDAILSNTGNLSEHFILLLSHELITRGCNLREFGNYYDYVDNANKNSVFKGLTLYPLDIEKDLALRCYGGVNFSMSHGNDYGFSPEGEEYKPLDSTSDSVEIEHCEKNDAIAKFVWNWKEHSNGVFVSAKGRYKRIDSEVGLLRQVVWEWLRPEIPKDAVVQYMLRSMTPHKIFRSVFSACQAGGAYSRGEYGAIGRLYSWESLHAMTAADTFVSNQAAFLQIQEFDWYEFDLDKWYDHIAWDIGILGINRNTREFAFLAVTDTD